MTFSLHALQPIQWINSDNSIKPHWKAKFSLVSSLLFLKLSGSFPTNIPLRKVCIRFQTFLISWFFIKMRTQKLNFFISLFFIIFSVKYRRKWQKKEKGGKQNSFCEIITEYFYLYKQMFLDLWNKRAVHPQSFSSAFFTVSKSFLWTLGNKEAYFVIQCIN